MTNLSSGSPHLAAHCSFVGRARASVQGEARAVCQHPVRDGTECVGPFLEDLTTSCGLWEPHPRSDLIPLPQPERWRRRRREGFDLGRGPRDRWR